MILGNLKLGPVTSMCPTVVAVPVERHEHIESRPRRVTYGKFTEALKGILPQSKSTRYVKGKARMMNPLSAERPSAVL